MIRGLEAGKKAALIVNECQLGVIDPAHAGFPDLAEQAVSRGIVARIATLADVFRAAGLPVFHTPVVHRPDFADILPNSVINSLTLKHRRVPAGSVEADYVEALRPVDGDFVVSRSSGLIAMNGTALDAILRRLQVRTLVLTGVSTNVAIPGNTMTAVDLGYQVVVCEDCIAASDADTHATIVREQLAMLAAISTADAVAGAIGAQ